VCVVLSPDSEEASIVSITLTAKASDSLYNISILEILYLFFDAIAEPLSGKGIIKSMFCTPFSINSTTVLLYASSSSLGVAVAPPLPKKYPFCLGI